MTSTAAYSPSAWSVDQVKAWATQVKLSEEVVSILVSNQVDGPTLVTLTKEDLRDELGIRSLPARRYIWDLIERIRLQQQSVDLFVALDAHQTEIEEFERQNSAPVSAPDESGGATQKIIEPLVFNVLRSDAESERQLLEDHLLAHRLQNLMIPGQQYYEDFELARHEQERLDQLDLQCEFDHQYALSVEGNTNVGHSRHQESAQSGGEAKSLFAQCLDTAIKNKVNVSNALESGRIKPIEPYDPFSAAASPFQPTDLTDEGKKPAAKETTGKKDRKLHPVVASLPFIIRCDVCFNDEVRGFTLPCDTHKQCVSCMTAYLKKALKDSSLLPLKCCEIPIDSNIASLLLEPADAEKLHFRESELLAKENKVNVNDALESGRIKPIQAYDPFSATVSPFQPTALTDEGKKPAATETTVKKDRKLHPVVASLPFIIRCDVCFKDEVRGFTLPCDTHKHCVCCMTNYLKAALKDSSLLPLKCCEIPIDSNIASLLLEPADAEKLHIRESELLATEKMYCPTCSQFINLDLIDNTFSFELSCGCGTALCTVCRTAAHPGVDCSSHQNRLGTMDEAVFQLAEEMGWRQCPKCSVMIELVYGCNHMVCASCSYEFCFKCLRMWTRGGSVCSSGNCEVWDEDRLLAAGEARIQEREAARGGMYRGEDRVRRVQEEMVALRANEDCLHDFVHRDGFQGTCERCGYDLYYYGYVCRGACRSTVCFTCANHRIPSRGWR